MVEKMSQSNATKPLATVNSKEGVKELKEVLDALFLVSLKLTAILKDGYQTSDLVQIFELFTADKEVREKIAAAADGISKIGGEVKDLDFSEGFELIQAMIPFIPRFVEVFKEKK